MRSIIGNPFYDDAFRQVKVFKSQSKSFVVLLQAGKPLPSSESAGGRPPASTGDEDEALSYYCQLVERFPRQMPVTNHALV